MSKCHWLVYTDTHLHIHLLGFHVLHYCTRGRRRVGNTVWKCSDERENNWSFLRYGTICTQTRKRCLSAGLDLFLNPPGTPYISSDQPGGLKETPAISPHRRGGNCFCRRAGHINVCFDTKPHAWKVHDDTNITGTFSSSSTLLCRNNVNVCLPKAHRWCLFLLLHLI